MMRRYSIPALAGLGALGLCGAVIGGLHAQEREAGIVSTLSWTLGLEAGRNLDSEDDGETSAEMSGRLEYAFQKQTRTSGLSFSASARSLWASDGDGDAFDQPRAALDYSYEGARTQLAFGASTARSDVSDLMLTVDADSGEVLRYTGTGTRQLNRVSARVAGGIDRPLGYSLTAGYTALRYTDIQSLDYNDRDTYNLGLSLRAELSPMSQLSVSLSGQQSEEEDLFETRESQASLVLRLDQRIDAITAASLSLGQTWNETETLLGTTSEDGATFGLGLTRETPRGLYRLDYDHQVSIAGDRDSVMLGRQLEGPTLALDGAIGLGRDETGATQAVGELTLSRSLRSDEIEFTLSRRMSLDNDDIPVVVSRADAGYRHVLGELSSVRVGLAASSIESELDDTLRMDLSAGYSYELTPGMDLVTGLRTELTQESGEEDEWSNAVFLNLTRSISARR